eukprot:4810419-Pleurochrysis_carterae.AAC.3
MNRHYLRSWHQLQPHVPIKRSPGGDEARDGSADWSGRRSQTVAQNNGHRRMRQGRDEITGLVARSRRAPPD